MDLGDGMFPLVDRQTPFIDRVRGAANEKFLGKSMGSVLAEMMVEEDAETRAESAEEIGDWFAKQIADDLGLPEEAISQDLRDEVKRVFTETAEVDALTDEALEELGLEPPSGSSDDSDDDDEEESSFSS